MKDIYSSLRHVEDSEKFREWKKKHKGFLCSIFMMCSADKLDGDWQFDFYSNGKITSFSDKAFSESDIFEKHELKELKLDKVNIKIEDALKIIRGLKEEKYKDESFDKIIIILQNGLWNISYITKSFKILNIKIDNKNGKITEESLKPLFSFM
ncbi:MAG: hypothetical protein AB1571_01430 [Nanoarchaeota archaeon]